jgi:hypothetical protein
MLVGRWVCKEGMMRLFPGTEQLPTAPCYSALKRRLFHLHLLFHNVPCDNFPINQEMIRIRQVEVKGLEWEQEGTYFKILKAKKVNTVATMLLFQLESPGPCQPAGCTNHIYSQSGTTHLQENRTQKDRTGLKPLSV